MAKPQSTSCPDGPLPESGLLDPGAHRFPVRVYWENTDAGGIVYHAEYLKFCERARSELLRMAEIHQNEMMADGQLAFAVAKMTLDFRRPAVLDDALVVVTTAETVGAASLTLRQVIHRPSDQALIVDASVRIACLNLATGGPARLPAVIRSKLLPFAADASPAPAASASTSPSSE